VKACIWSLSLFGIDPTIAQPYTRTYEIPLKLTPYGIRLGIGFFFGISVIPIVGWTIIGITDCWPDPNRYVIPIPIPIPILSVS